MKRNKKGLPKVKKGVSDLMNAHDAVKKFIDKSNTTGEENEDPRFQNLPKRQMSRKERRKQERQAKKSRKRAFHSRIKGDVEGNTSKADEEVAVKKTDIKEEENIEKNRKMKQAAEKKKRKLKVKEIKDVESRRKEALLAANEIEDRNIKRLEKSLRFRKKKKTREVIIPGQFKYDGLDYLLDVTDSKKLEIMKEEDEDLAKKLDLQQLKEHHTKLAGNLHSVDEIGDEDSDGDSVENSEDGEKVNLRSEGGSFEDHARDGPGLQGPSDDEDDTDDESGDDEDVMRDLDDLEGGYDESESSEGDDLKSGVKFEKHKGNSNLKERAFQSDGRTKVHVDVESEEDDSEGDENIDHRSKAKAKRKRNGNIIGHDDESRTSIGKESSEEGGKDSSSRKRKAETKMDPYGNVKGEENAKDSGSYIPPHKRAMMMGESMDMKRKAELEKLRRQLKGLINRLSSSNVLSISREIESLYLTRSRNDMNETLYSIVDEAVVIRSMSSDRLVMELVLLVALLHFNVGSQVGAYFLQSMAIKFDNLHKNLPENNLENKECDNALLVLIHLYNFKIVHCCLMYDIIRRLVERFTEQDIEMLLLLLKGAGISLRKDDPLALKEIIILIQGKASSSSEEFIQQSRVKFMLETIIALRNNDIRKLPNMEHLESLRKILKNLTKNRDHSMETSLRIPLEDLLSADQKGRWWIVGSAWTGHGPNRTERQTAGADSSLPVVKMDQSTSEKIMNLSRQQGMNTDLRRSIFGIVMTAEDYQDCFNKLLQLAVKNKQEKECVLVLINCCQQEKQFNLYYAHVLSKLCLFERKFRIACQFAYWDRFKILDQVTKTQINNLASLFAHLLLSKACSLAVLKVIEFSDMNKNTATFLKKLLLKVLQQTPDKVRMIFEAVTGNEKLSHLRDTLGLFLHHFILKQRGTRTDDEQTELKEKIGVADRAMKGEREVNM